MFEHCQLAKCNFRVSDVLHHYIKPDRHKNLNRHIIARLRSIAIFIFIKIDGDVSICLRYPVLSIGTTNLRAN